MGFDFTTLNGGSRKNDTSDKVDVGLEDRSFRLSDTTGENQDLPLREMRFNDLPNRCPIQRVNDHYYRVMIYESIEDLPEYTNVISLLDLATEQDTVDIIISSPGGMVCTGNQIVAAIHRSKANVTTIAVGVVASMGASIWTAGKTHVMDEDAFVMYHMAANSSGYDYVANIAASSNGITDYVADCMLQEAVTKGLLLPDERDLIKGRKGREIFLSYEVLKDRGVSRLERTS